MNSIFVSVLFQNIGDQRVEEVLTTTESEPLHLAVLTVNDTITEVFLVGDTVVIKSPTTDILSGVLLLLISYYVFDLDYPRIYANFFSVLQTLSVGEPI